MQIGEAEIMEIAHGTRLPRSITRFEGVLESVISRGGSDLLPIHQETLSQRMQTLPLPIFELNAEGDKPAESILSDVKEGTFIIGANVEPNPASHLDAQLEGTETEITKLKIVDYELSSSAAASYLLTCLHHQRSS